MPNDSHTEQSLSLRKQMISHDGRRILPPLGPYISRVEQSDLMILLARTTPLAEVEKRSRGVSVFLVDLREAEGLTVKPRRVMMNNATNEGVFDGLCATSPATAPRVRTGT